ncbi:hypothetical protein [Sphingopyxis flava]|uniref:Uncharacterized protein n=1 Tax=Sphingopyxis flava TaxID=1507287 RepID=A0A1T5CTP3_9SPHN|nr:hypothetical protein [Sphingopyxis flava]SKB62794.1 hypothetical protein SAMN06295937_1011106 [Sphingopyxis flava]
MTLKSINRKRLDKLATYLESLPKSYEHFDMDSYLVPDHAAVQTVKDYALHNGGVASCGTVACAVGHGPAAGIYVPPKMIFDDHRVDWNSYSCLFTGESGEFGPRWYWMFGGGWDEVDNHHWGAAARIRYVLADKPIPKDCDEPCRGHRQLYREFDKRYAS